MNHNFKSLRARICAVFVLGFSLASTGISAQQNGLGDVRIDTDLLKINNIISNSNTSTAKILAAGVKDSSATGSISIRVNAKNIENKISNGTKNISTIRIGHIEKATLNNAKIDLQLKSVRNLISGGSKNTASINIGSIRNSNVSGKIDIKIRAQSDIRNSIRNGYGSSSEISIGSISSHDDDNNNLESRDYATQTFPNAYNVSLPLPIEASVAITTQNIIKQKAATKNDKQTQSAAIKPTDSGKYTIEKRQSSIGSVGGHNFLVIKDSKGNIIKELHGLSVDLKTGDANGKIGKGKRGLRVREFDPNYLKYKSSGRVKKGQPSATLFTGSKEAVMKLWAKALKKGDAINGLALPYPTLGVKLFTRRTINSNSVESTLSAIMGLKSPKLKLPLTIQDLAQAIEYDTEPEQSFLFTPGEGRIIPVN